MKKIALTLIIIFLTCFVGYLLDYRSDQMVRAENARLEKINSIIKYRVDLKTFASEKMLLSQRVDLISRLRSDLKSGRITSGELGIENSGWVGKLNVISEQITAHENIEWLVVLKEECTSEERWPSPNEISEVQKKIRQVRSTFLIWIEHGGNVDVTAYPIEGDRSIIYIEARPFNMDAVEDLADELVNKGKN